MESILKYTGDRKFDAVFSSEGYGARLARELGAQNVEVDIKRQKFPVSASQIRSHPKAYKKYIPKVVRSYYKDRLK
jgi:HTH-type transcriptional repressor of NAD biosynthesis genes